MGSGVRVLRQDVLLQTLARAMSSDKQHLGSRGLSYLLEIRAGGAAGSAEGRQGNGHSRRDARPGRSNGSTRCGGTRHRREKAHRALQNAVSLLARAPLKLTPGILDVGGSARRGASGGPSWKRR